MKALDMVRRLAVLLESRKVSEEEAHAIFNGTKITTSTGVGTYANGNLVLGHGVVPLSADKITDVEWPKPKVVKPGLTEKKPATFRKKFDSES